MGVTAWLPGLDTARRYQRSWLRADVGAGVVLAALLVPVGMGYAEAAHLPLVAGLATTVVGLVAYALVGPSPRLVLGPDSSLAPLIATAVVPLAATDGEAVAVGSALALAVGVWCVAAGLARAGTLAELLSEPVRLGYLAGLAVIVIAEQLPATLGLEVDATTFIGQVTGIVDALADDGVDILPAVVAAACVVTIAGLGHWVPRAPGVLVAVVGATVVSAVWDLSGEGLAVIGQLPTGLPAPAWPELEAGDLGRIVAASLGIALVAMADTGALSRSVAQRERQGSDPAVPGGDVDADREVIALGVANLATGGFGGFPTSASTSRTAVARASGAHTQVAGLVAAALVAFLMAAGTSLVADLPEAALAAVVIAAVAGFVDVAGFHRLWRLRRSEWLLGTASLAAVVVLGPLEGIGVAVVISLANVVRHTWRPHDAVLGRIEGRKGYHDRARHPEAHHIPGLLLYRFDAPLFFANADHFARRLRRLLEEAPERVRWVVVAAEPITDVDTSAATVLSDLVDELEARDVELAFAELKGPVRDRLVAYGLADRMGAGRFFPTVGTAVSAYVAASGVPWVDWQDRPGPRTDC